MTSAAGTGNLHEAAWRCLAATDPDVKCRLASAVRVDWLAGALQMAPLALTEGADAGRPDRPELVPPANLPKRRLGSQRGQAAMIHAIAHIEFNAINLAADALYRFQRLPAGFYDDWTRVLEEEARHFGLLQQRLAELGCRYGDFPAHNGLWEMAVRTRSDPMVRMALVPRLLEARGLDVTPGIRAGFERIGDQRTCTILDIILRDEVGHVEAGSRWFNHLCRKAGKDPEATYFELLDAFAPGIPSLPLARDHRLRAGFTVSELDRLEALCTG